MSGDKFMLDMPLLSMPTYAALLFVTIDGLRRHHVMLEFFFATMLRAI